LHKPFGRLLKNGLEKIKNLSPDRLVSVGDVTTKRFNENNMQQKISVIDLLVERKKIYTKKEELGFTGFEKIIYITNPPGILTKGTWKSIKKMTTSLYDDDRYIMQVTGEEDLLVLPLILLLPVGFSLFYGQPHDGLVWVTVDFSSKEEASKIVKQFQPITTRGY
jgi:uncharacterized protein (UPF0218 family)